MHRGPKCSCFMTSGSWSSLVSINSFPKWLKLFPRMVDNAVNLFSNYSCSPTTACQAEGITFRPYAIFTSFSNYQLFLRILFPVLCFSPRTVDFLDLTLCFQKQSLLSKNSSRLLCFLSIVFSLSIFSVVSSFPVNSFLIPRALLLFLVTRLFFPGVLTTTQRSYILLLAFPSFLIFFKVTIF